MNDSDQCLGTARAAFQARIHLGVCSEEVRDDRLGEPEAACVTWSVDAEHVPAEPEDARLVDGAPVPDFRMKFFEHPGSECDEQWYVRRLLEGAEPLEPHWDSEVKERRHGRDPSCNERVEHLMVVGN